MGIQIDAQTVSTESGKYSYLLQYDDDTEFNENLKPAITDINGSYPKDENEIMLTKQILGNMGITSPKVGQNVTLVMNGERKICALRLVHRICQEQRMPGVKEICGFPGNRYAERWTCQYLRKGGQG